MIEAYIEITGTLEEPYVRVVVWASIVSRYRYSKRQEVGSGCRMIYAAFPSVFGLGLEDGINSMASFRETARSQHRGTH